ncbi:hypothetical protein [Okeania sp. SIO2C9]|nr:hypothetical protein [Okeania sp. SIO2C9]
MGGWGDGEMGRWGAVRGCLKSCLIVNFAPLAPQFWGEQESISW